MQKSPLLIILYDSITNSVFESQLLYPLLQQYPDRKITLISFEKKNPIKTHKKLVEKLTQLSLTFIWYYKVPFMGRISLWPAIIKTRLYILKFSFSRYTRYEILARGPFAGYIARYAATSACTHSIIQARGLAAQEYMFDKAKLSRFQQLRYKQLLKLERKAYGYTQNPVRGECSTKLEKRSRMYRTITELLSKILFTPTITIQAVSPALKEYLIKTFNTPAQSITIAEHDIPEKINPALLRQWRREIRDSLTVSETTEIYCYNGSAKPWQCPQEVINYFKNLQKKYIHKNLFLLILSQDEYYFEQLCSTTLEPKNYAVLSVAYHELYRFLAAADYGLLFRQPHVINWVSRPTKALEYKAAGLTIIHNNTVKYLIDYSM